MTEVERLRGENARLRLCLGRMVSTVFGEDEGDPPKYPSWEEALRGCVEALTPSNEELLRLARESPPPREWYDGDEDLFGEEAP